MADDEIPEDLLALQRERDAATAALKALPGDADPSERGRLRDAERAAVLALHRALQDTPFYAYPQHRRLEKAARGEG